MKYIDKFFEVINRTELLDEDRARKKYIDGVSALTEAFCNCRLSSGTVFFIGNGGSAAIATHMTADFMKNGGVRTISLYDSSILTCLGNDYGYEYVFSKQLEMLAQENDLLVAISSSGSSRNIIRAIEIAKGKGVRAISFTGFAPENPVRMMSDISVYVPSNKYGIVESIHNLILQQIVDMMAEKAEKDT